MIRCPINCFIPLNLVSLCSDRLGIDLECNRLVLSKFSLLKKQNIFHAIRGGDIPDNWIETAIRSRIKHVWKKNIERIVLLSFSNNQILGVLVWFFLIKKYKKSDEILRS